MNQPVELSLEQQFSLRSFEAQVNQMSPEQTRELLIMLFHQMLVKDSLTNELIKKSWSIE